MSDFLTRLIERSTGTADMVYPMITSMYANDWHNDEKPSPEIDLHNDTHKTEGKAYIITSSSSERSHLNNQNSGLVIPLSSENHPHPNPLQEGEGVDVHVPLRRHVGIGVSSAFDKNAAGDAGDFQLKEYSEKEYNNTQKSDRIMTDMPVREDKQEIYSQSKPKATSFSNELTKEPEKGRTSLLAYQHSLSLVQENPEYEKKAIYPELIRNQTEKRSAPRDNYQAALKSSSTDPTITNPTIKITIGRIEVKAIMQQSAPPRRAVQHPPKLSLEDYLKQRSGGQR